MRFEPWKCNCGCPFSRVYDHTAHTINCAAFIPVIGRREEGGSG